jgi:hypothetical protein
MNASKIITGTSGIIITPGIKVYRRTYSVQFPVSVLRILPIVIFYLIDRRYLIDKQERWVESGMTGFESVSGHSIEMSQVSLCKSRGRIISGWENL